MRASKYGTYLGKVAVVCAIALLAAACGGGGGGGGNGSSQAKIPNLDQVTFVPRTEQPTELNAIRTGEALAIYPQPSTAITKQVSSPGLKYTEGAGTTYEGLWMNLGVFPFNDPQVRLAFAYAVDRQGVVDSLYRPDFPDLKVLNCAGWVPNVSDWCDDSQFADLTYQARQGQVHAAGRRLDDGPGRDLHQGRQAAVDPVHHDGRQQDP